MTKEIVSIQIHKSQALDFLKWIDRNVAGGHYVMEQIIDSLSWKFDIECIGGQWIAKEEEEE